MTESRFFLFFCASFLLVACGDDDGPEDAATDVPSDVQTDSPQTDAPADAPSDSGTDTDTREACNEAGATRSASCGMCGMGQETCTAGFWQLSGPCLGQGECAPGDLETEATDMCGELSRLCDNACTWGDFEQTTPDKDCTPGAERNDTSACADDEYGTEVCSDQCEWEATGVCEAYCPNLDTDGLDEEVCVPEGPFIRGSELCRVPLEMAACPQAEVQMSTYAIDRFPVTLERYRECQANGPCLGRAGNDSEARPNTPAEVMLLDAEQYCSWVGRRLPSEAMIEKALRGPAPRTANYPWGGDNYCDGNQRPGCAGNLDHPYPLETYPADRGWYPIESVGLIPFWSSDKYSTEFYSDPASLVDPEQAQGFAQVTRQLGAAVWDRREASRFDFNYFRCARYVNP